MLFVQIIVIIAVLGIAWYFLKPIIEEPFRTMVVVVAILGFCLWLLTEFNIIHIPLGR